MKRPLKIILLAVIVFFGIFYGWKAIDKNSQKPIEEPIKEAEKANFSAFSKEDIRDAFIHIGETSSTWNPRQYDIIILGDGKVMLFYSGIVLSEILYYDRLKHKFPKPHKEWRISEKQFREILSEFEKAGFFSLGSSPPIALDLPDTIMTLRIGENRKFIINPDREATVVIREKIQEILKLNLGALRLRALPVK